MECNYKYKSINKEEVTFFQKYFITENGKNNIYISAIDIVFDYFKIMFPTTLLRKKNKRKRIEGHFFGREGRVWNVKAYQETKKLRAYFKNLLGYERVR